MFCRILINYYECCVVIDERNTKQNPHDQHVETPSQNILIDNFQRSCFRTQLSELSIPHQDKPGHMILHAFPSIQIYTCTGSVADSEEPFRKYRNTLYMRI